MKLSHEFRKLDLELKMDKSISHADAVNKIASKLDSLQLSLENDIKTPLIEEIKDLSTNLVVTQVALVSSLILFIVTIFVINILG